MSSNIDSLIISVSNALKDFAEGKMPFEKAKSEYKKLSAKYEKIAIKQDNPEGSDKLAGLCYFNNIENYSLFSGLYKINTDGISRIASSGDSSLREGIEKALSDSSDNPDKLKENQILQIKPDEDNTLLNSIYIFPFQINKTARAAFVAVSSSSFFSEDKFRFLAKLIKNIISVIVSGSEETEKSYFLMINNEVEKYISENTDNEHSVCITLFVFNMFEKVFNHLGLHAIFEASDEILNVIKEKYGNNQKCYTLSVRDFIVLQRINKDDTQKNNKNKLEFSYKNMNLQYNSLKIVIDKKEPVNSLWNKIMTFENYLSTGDIIK